MPPRQAARQGDKQPFIARMIDEAASRAPPQYAGYIRQVKPVVVGIANAIDAAWPYIVLAYTYVLIAWEKAQPYNPQRYLPLAAGLAMCFFGGSYLTVIAAVEAVRLSVWERLSASMSVLYKNWKIAQEASAKDDKRDDDNDGVPDVHQISNSELFSRKMYVFAKAINPDQTHEALSAVWGGFLSVIATIRIKFAQFITLGCSMGDMARDNFGPKIEPMIKQALPPELEKWSPTIVKQIFTTLGIILALFLQQVVGGFHAAVRGSQIATGNAICLAQEHGFLSNEFNPKGREASAAGMVLALFGFVWQLRNGFAVPFPLNIFFFPVSIVEWILSFSLTVGL